MQLSKSRSRLDGRLALLILAVALLFSAFVRWRLRNMPLERDEGEYAYAGQLLLLGIAPYQLAFSMKLPGTHLAYAAIMAVFGETASGIHLGLMSVNLATIALLFLLTRDLFDSFAGGIAAATYSLLAVSPSIPGTAAHATHFVTFFSVAATWTLWRALQSDKKPLLFLSGLLFGTAFLMKQHGVFLSGFGAVAVLIHYARLRPLCWRKVLAGVTVFALGAVLPYAGTCLWLWWAGVFDRFWFWTVTFSGKHVSETSYATGAGYFWRSFTDVAAPNWPLWIAAMLGGGIVWTTGSKGARWFTYAYFAFSFLCLCPGFFFRAHYFIVLFPALSIFSGAACSRLIDSTRSQIEHQGTWNHRNQSFSWLAIVILMATGGFMLWQQWEFFLLRTPEQACRELYGLNPFVESPVIADYLRRHSTPEQRVAVLGSEPQLYFYATRLSATGYIYAYELTEPTPFALQMQQEMCRQIEAAKPEFLVFVHCDLSWLAKRDSDRFILDWTGRYAKSFYRPVGLVDIISPTRTEYQWGAQAAQAHPRSTQYVWIFQRKN